jgi:hypothetical protein
METLEHDLIAFLAARLAEDEAAAKAAQLRFPGPWDRAVTPDSPLPSAVSLYDSLDESFGVIRGSYAAAHIARHDPARVLREVEAKRAIMAAHPAADDEGQLFCSTCVSDAELYDEEFGAGRWPCVTVRALIAVYSDHPDYRQEWAP